MGQTSCPAPGRRWEVRAGLAVMPGFFVAIYAVFRVGGLETRAMRRHPGMNSAYWYLGFSRFGRALFSGAGGVHWRKAPCTVGRD
jgi:hypothetical protein